MKLKQNPRDVDDCILDEDDGIYSKEDNIIFCIYLSVWIIILSSILIILLMLGIKG